MADSLVALDLPAVRDARRIADLGSGAGWPGLALAAALPDARVALVESAIRHCRYLERAVAAGRLENAEVVHARAEEWADGLGAHDVVTARALAALPVLCEYAAPLLADGGVLVAWKGAVDDGRGGGGRDRRGAARARAGRGARGRAVSRGRTPHPARVPQGRAHAGALPAASGDGGQAAAGLLPSAGRSR